MKLKDKVKAKCKDMGLSEKYLDGLIEALGKEIKDDSTDEEVEKVANLIESVAKNAQAEATRWAQNEKDKKNTEEEKKTEEKKTEEKSKEDEEPAYFKSFRESLEKRINDLEEKEKASAEEKAAAQRTANINAALDKYKIPQAIRKYVGNVPADVEDIDKYIGEAAQTVVTSQLPFVGGGEQKVPTEKAVEETGKGWFSRLTGKSTESSNK